MQCEMCGSSSKGPLKRVRIEGAELLVCSACARYGVEVQGQRASVPSFSSQKNQYDRPSSQPKPTRSRDVFDMIEGDIVDNYSDIIRKARMEKGLSQKELALEMKEKELLIKKIEKGDLIPEDSVRRKFEKILGISLIESGGFDSEDQHQNRMATTMGDVIKIKKIKR
ncbi:MAG: TIGR00270 family protein [Methanospirillaceae archaeon]|nr:TIGR00270 family protein [Methanospirillaceae archaeon]